MRSIASPQANSQFRNDNEGSSTENGERDALGASLKSMPQEDLVELVHGSQGELERRRLIDTNQTQTPCVKRVVKLNVGGTAFATSMDHLLGEEGSLFHDILVRREDVADKEIFFDRSPQLFSFLIDFIREGPEGNLVLDSLSRAILVRLAREAEYFAISRLKTAIALYLEAMDNPANELPKVQRLGKEYPQSNSSSQKLGTIEEEDNEKNDASTLLEDEWRHHLVSSKKKVEWQNKNKSACFPVRSPTSSSEETKVTDD